MSPVELSAMIVAVTGANGFIGQHLVARFAAAGWQVRPVVRADFARREIAAFRGADVVVHAAGATRAPTRAELRVSNVELTRRVVHEARTAGATRIIFISSQAAAGPARSRDLATTELDPPAPREAYGRSKLDAEAIVRDGAMPFVILRPVAVYGPADRDFLAMFRWAGRGIAVHAANRAQWISLVHVHDVADGVIAAAGSDSGLGETLFLSSDEPVQWCDLFRHAAAAAGRRVAVDVEVPRAIVALGAGVGDVAARVTGRAGLLTSEKLALAEPPFWIASNERAKRLLGFAPRVSLQTGIAETYHWYRDRGWL